MSTKARPNPTRLILVRHGESEGNRDRTFTQSEHVPLTDLGCEQAHAAAVKIARRYNPSRMVASPYARAVRTAEIIAQHFNLAIEIEPDLREQSFGIFAGQPYTALLGDAAYHEGPRWDWRPAGGESLVDVGQRAVPVLERLAREGAGTDTVIVSHGGVMLALCAFVAGTWDGIGVTANAGVVLVELRDGHYTPPLTIED